ncbi:hypothetical protein [uncultured Kordia sp.]|uniref:hypothetical protein n=1 Tax=uncultured Kordia sp. TaxID=507699 RepID=UPI00260C2950|nr:hypothetical protein [uncultured Kordia sp.]
MKKLITAVFTLFIFNSLIAQTNETDEYVEFDDRKNIVHGIYLGVTPQYGRISGENAGFLNIKFAYVANRKVEIGFSGTVFGSIQPNNTNIYRGNEVLLAGGYGGLHLEPILYGNRSVSISFPLMIGGGLATILEKKEDGEFDESPLENDTGDDDSFFIAEPGVNILYNVSRFLQIEAGFRYRISESFRLPYYGKENIKGFSVGIGLKIGIFNMGRKKKIKDKF